MRVVFVCEVPREQFVDPVYRMVSDPGQDQAEIAFRVQSVELSRGAGSADGVEPGQDAEDVSDGCHHIFQELGNDMAKR
jgi:hypothetical protein